MSKAQPIQTNVTAGEVGQLIGARVDIDKYSHALEICENFWIFQQGAAFRRSGSRFIAEVKDSSKTTRLVPFEFSDVQAYVLEFGDLYFRVYKDEGRIEIASVPIEFVTLFAESDIPNLSWAQSADILFMCSGVHPVQKITRTSDTLWTVTEFVPLDGPYFVENTDTTVTVTPAAVTGSGIAVTSSSPLFASSDTSGTGGTGVVDRAIRIRHGATVGWATIASFISSTSITVDIKADFGATTATSTWRLGSWSSTTGFPKHVTFHEERFVLANTTAQPDTFFMSKSADFEAFSPTEFDGSLIDDNGIAYTLGANKVNAINFLSSGNSLLIGTLGAEWEVSSDSLDTPITPTNVNARRTTSKKSRENVQAFHIDSSTFFIQKAGRKLIEHVSKTDELAADDVTILSPHILREGTAAVQLEYQAEPQSIIHVIREDGQLATMTYNRRQKVFGWSRQIFGGDAKIKSDAVIPSLDGNDETTYLIAERTIDGGIKKYVEFIEEDFYPTSGQDKEDMFFVDSGLSLNNLQINSGDLTSGNIYRVVDSTGGDYSVVGGPSSPTDGEEFTATSTATPTYGTGFVREVQATITGLDHLEGELVQVCGDGANLPNETVSSGSITLAKNVAFASVGYQYISKIKTLRIEAGGSLGTAQGKMKRIDHLSIRVLDSIGFSFGTDEDNLDLKSFTEESLPMDQSPPFFTGNKDADIEDGYNLDGQYFIAQTQCYPLNILALMPELTTYQQ